MSQSPYTNYPRGPVASPGNPEIRFDSISRAFEYVKNNLVLCAAAALVTLVPPLVISLIVQLITPRPDKSDPAAAMAALGPTLGISLVSNLVQAVVYGVMLVCMSNFMLNGIRRGTADFSDYTTGFSKAGYAAAGGLLYQIGVMIGLMLCCIPGFIVSILGMFIYLEIADSNGSPVEAFMASMEKVKSQFFMAFAFQLVVGLLAGCGILACGIGILFTLPLALGAQAIVFMDITGTGPGYAMQAPTSPYGAPTSPSPYASPTPVEYPAPQAPTAPSEAPMQPPTEAPQPPQSEPPTAPPI